MKNQAFNKIGVLTALLASAVCAHASVIDQSQVLVNTGIPFAGDYPVGQSFTAGMSGLLSEIDVASNGAIYTNGVLGGSDLVTLDIHAGDGVSGTLLGTETISVSNSSITGTAWILMSTSSLDIDLVQGQQYTFDITNVTGTGDLAARGIVGDMSNPYAGGQIYAAGYLNPASWDLVFRTDVSTGTVPEPASIALVGIALFGIAASRRKRA